MKVNFISLGKFWKILRDNFFESAPGFKVSLYHCAQTNQNYGN